MTNTINIQDFLHTDPSPVDFKDMFNNCTAWYWHVKGCDKYDESTGISNLYDAKVGCEYCDKHIPIVEHKEEEYHSSCLMEGEDGEMYCGLCDYD